MFSTVSTLLTALWCTALACATLVTNDTRIAVNQTYDYVIVGAGLSGITVANKLSERGYSTLVIEADPEPRWNLGVTVAGDRVFHGSYCNWLYTAYAENGTALPAPSMRVLALVGAHPVTSQAEVARLMHSIVKLNADETRLWSQRNGLAQADSG